MKDEVVIAKITDGTFIIGENRGDGVGNALQIYKGEFTSIAYPFETRIQPHFVPNSKILVILEEDEVTSEYVEYFKGYREFMEGF